jgi:hypothetical protein
MGIASDASVKANSAFWNYPVLDIQISRSLTSVGEWFS